ncbi:unnamed protein product, partial [marine sediment metagenome]
NDYLKKAFELRELAEAVFSRSLLPLCVGDKGHPVLSNGSRLVMIGTDVSTADHDRWTDWC